MSYAYELKVILKRLIIKQKSFKIIENNSLKACVRQRNFVSLLYKGRESERVH